MIDTDKYEGHKEGPWKIYFDKWERSGWYIDSIARYNIGEGDEICKLLGYAQRKDPTANLIQDAPLLLEEVKRLRKTLACIAFSPDDPEWVSEKLDELEVDSDTWKRWHE